MCTKRAWYSSATSLTVISSSCLWRCTKKVAKQFQRCERWVLRAAMCRQGQQTELWYTCAVARTVQKQVNKQFSVTGSCVPSLSPVSSTIIYSWYMPFISEFAMQQIHLHTHTHTRGCVCVCVNVSNDHHTCIKWNLFLDHWNLMRAKCLHSLVINIECSSAQIVVHVVDIQTMTY